MFVQREKTALMYKTSRCWVAIAPLTSFHLNSTLKILACLFWVNWVMWLLVAPKASDAARRQSVLYFLKCNMRKTELRSESAWNPHWRAKLQAKKSRRLDREMPGKWVRTQERDLQDEISFPVTWWTMSVCLSYSENNVFYVYGSPYKWKGIRHLFAVMYRQTC